MEREVTMRVLVAEDHERLARSLAAGLRRHGMTVDVVFDGEETLARMDTGRYDVLILDRDLPGTHGDEVCRTLAAERCESRILMLTASGAIEDRIEGLGLGADDYLPKPFDFDELPARVRALGRRPGAAQTDRLGYADLILDPATRVATRAGRRLDLRPKELAVLECLLLAQGTAYRKPRLPQIPHTPALATFSLPQLPDALAHLKKDQSQLSQAQHQLALLYGSAPPQNISLPTAGSRLVTPLTHDQEQLTHDQHNLSQAVKRLAQAVHQVSQAGAAQTAQRAPPTRINYWSTRVSPSPSWPRSLSWAVGSSPAGPFDQSVPSRERHGRSPPPICTNALPSLLSLRSGISCRLHSTTRQRALICGGTQPRNSSPPTMSKST